MGHKHIKSELVMALIEMWDNKYSFIEAYKFSPNDLTAVLRNGNLLDNGVIEDINEGIQRIIQLEFVEGSDDSLAEICFEEEQVSESVLESNRKLLYAVLGNNISGCDKCFKLYNELTEISDIKTRKAVLFLESLGSLMKGISKKPRSVCDPLKIRYS